MYGCLLVLLGLAEGRSWKDELMPAPPRWLLAVPDAVRQLEKLDRDLLTRRDLERLLGVSRARAAQLMRTFGAELVGAARVLRRTEFLRPAAEVPGSGPPSAARSSGARAWCPSSGRRGSPGSGSRCRSRRSRRASRGLPEGVTVAPGRIEVRFAGAKEAVGESCSRWRRRWTNDYERFETIVGKGERSG